MTVAVASQQILAGVTATVSVTMTDQNGEPTDASGAVTVGINRWDGTVLVAAGGATTHGTTGVYSYTLTATQTATLDLLTATWSVAGGGSQTTLVDIVGGYHFSIAEFRALYQEFADMGRYPNSRLLATRRQVETECEKICDLAFVPRFRSVTVWGGGVDYLDAPDRMIRKLRAINFGNIALSADALTNTVATADGRLQRYWPYLSNATDDSWAQWGERFPYATRVTLAYEYGLDRAPFDIRGAEMMRMRSVLLDPDSAIPANATSYSSADGNTYQLGAANITSTGIDDIDAVYQRYAIDRGGVASVAIQ